LTDVTFDAGPVDGDDITLDAGTPTGGDVTLDAGPVEGTDVTLEVGTTAGTEITLDAGPVEGSDVSFDIPAPGGGGGGVELGETSTTAYRGDRGKTAYDHSQATGNPHGAAVADITGLTTALASKLDGSDASVTNSRTPTAHAASHASAGSDPITVAQSQVTNLGTDLAAKVPATRTVAGHALSADVTIAPSDLTTDPLARANHTGTQTLSTISDAGTAAALNVPSSGDAASGEVVKGSDTRLASEAWRIDIAPWSGITTVVGTIGSNVLRSVDASSLSSMLTLGNAANLSAAWDIYMSAGTWAIDIIYRTVSGNGSGPVTLSGTSLLTLNCYSASTVRNNVSTTTGISVSTSGVKSLKIATLTAGAGSGYSMEINWITLRRTA
jgi:hypothetical protein